MKMLWNLKVTIIPILIEALETVSKDPEKKLGEQDIRKRIETIQTTVKII